MGFSEVMVVSGEADPCHLSAGSPSTGQSAYFEKGPDPPIAVISRDRAGTTRLYDEEPLR